MEDLIFEPIKAVCPKCLTFLLVSFESLQEGEEVICSKCNHRFTPNVDVDRLVKIMKAIEEGRLKKTLPEPE